MKKIRPVGRPQQEATQVIRAPVEKIPAIEKELGRKLVSNQKPTVMIRVPVSKIKRIKKIIKGEK